MQIGMLHHLQSWILHIRKIHEQLNEYNAIWISVPACNSLKPKNVVRGSISIERKDDNRNWPVPACCCNTDSMRWKPHLASHIQLCN
jgi:hypothetical protein